MLTGRSPHTIDNYQRSLCSLMQAEPDLDAWDLPFVKSWIAEGASAPVRRMRARAVKAFCRWLTEEDIADTGWWKRIRLPAVDETPQETVTESDYTRSLALPPETVPWWLCCGPRAFDVPKWLGCGSRISTSTACTCWCRSRRPSAIASPRYHRRHARPGSTER